MADVIYLITSLPSLALTQTPPPITLDEFDRIAQNHLSTTNFEKVVAPDLKKFDGSDEKMLGQLAAPVELLRSDVQEIRQARQDGRVPVLRVLPATVLEMNPLERENAILKWHWDMLSSLEFEQNFTLAEVALYRLKLQLVWRIASFDVERGASLLTAVMTPQKMEDD